MTDRADYPLRTLRLCDSALKSQHPDGIPRRICRARRTNAAESGILFGVAADGHCLFPAGMQVDRAARRVEASASDQLIRHARALSGLCPAPPPFVYFVYFVVNPPRRICRGARVYGKKGIWYNVCVNGDVYGTC